VLQPSEMLEVVADRDVWRLNLELLPPQPSRTLAGSERRRRKKRPKHFKIQIFSLILVKFKKLLFIAHLIFFQVSDGLRGSLNAFSKRFLLAISLI